MIKVFGSVAQSVEQGPFSAEGGSASGGKPPLCQCFGSVAQSVEQGPFKPKVAGSIPAGPKALTQLTSDVAGSIPAGPTAI